jgi:CRISPR-associated protein Cst2
MNIFGSVLTYPAPSANYRGDSELNRAVIQKVTYDRFEYPIISPEAMRNALREMLSVYRLPCNRSRVEGKAGDDKEELRVKFADWPDAEKYADDFFFGYLLALKGKDDPSRKRARQDKSSSYPTKRDSILRMNLAKALQPYRHDAVFTQSPLNVDSPWKNADQSALLHRETAVTAFQYPFALNLNDCGIDDDTNPVDGIRAPDGKAYRSRGDQHKDWLRYLLKAIAELNGVAGNHARSYFEMAPASIVIRLTDSLVAGYETYGFRPDGSFPELVDGILHDDYPGKEFYMGGLLVKQLLNQKERPDEEKTLEQKLRAKGVQCFRMANGALDAVATKVCGKGFLPEANVGKERS